MSAPVSVSELLLLFVLILKTEGLVTAVKVEVCIALANVVSVFSALGHDLLADSEGVCFLRSFLPICRCVCLHTVPLTMYSSFSQA